MVTAARTCAVKAASSSATTTSPLRTLTNLGAAGTGKAVGVHQRGAGEAVIGVARRQQCHQRHRVIGQRGDVGRHGAEGGAVLGGEGGIGVGSGAAYQPPSSDASRL